MVLSLVTAGAAAGGTAAAGASAGKTLFDYNRENFLYDRNLRQETEYTMMEFRNKQTELWREDIECITGLTTEKMDTYLIVNAVQLGFCVMGFCEGRMAAGTPTWLIGCHTLSIAGAFTYLLMSVWLAMHATVAAKSYETRLLTQLVRLPIPSWAQLEGARTYGSMFEKIEPRQMFRVPFVMGSQESVLKNSRMTSTQQSVGPASGNRPVLEDNEQGSAAGNDAISMTSANDAPVGADSSADPWGLEGRGNKIFELDGTIRGNLKDLRHFRLVREASQHWQSYDGFARVAMSIGTNQLVFALSYYVLGYVGISLQAIMAAWLAVILFVSIALGLIRLDMSLTKGEWFLCCFLCSIGPFCMCVATREWAKIGTDMVVLVLAPIPYLSHLCWMLLILHVSKIDEQKSGVMLPMGFRTVMYVDVFGWIKSPSGSSLMNALVSVAGPRSLPEDMVNGAGPGVQAVKYAKGQPVPQRIEDLPNASQAPQLQSNPKKAFDPSSFAPRAKLEVGDQEEEYYSDWKTSKPGARPWKVFCGATSLLALLWAISGILVTAQSMGYEGLTVYALLREAEEEEVVPAIVAYEEEHPEADLLQGGQRVVTQLQSGQRVVTHWPDANIRPFGLSCDGDAHQMVASTRFGLFTADIGCISNSTKHGRKPGASFVAAPLCEAIEGEPIQDVSMHCHPSASGNICEAMVLHRKGRRISTCNLSTTSSKSSQKDLALTATNATDAWLSPDSHSLAEGITSLASAPHCAIRNNKDCAFIGTSSQRIVEMHRGYEISLAGNSNWSPNRLLRAEQPGSSKSMSSGALHVINKRYLGLLLAGSNRLEVLDLEKEGAVAGSWVLPQNNRWNAMCATGDDLFLLSKGPSPELWHFPVPKELKSERFVSLAQTKPPGAHKTAGACERHHIRHYALAAFDIR